MEGSQEQPGGKEFDFAATAEFLASKRAQLNRMSRELAALIFNPEKADRPDQTAEEAPPQIT